MARNSWIILAGIALLVLPVTIGAQQYGVDLTGTWQDNVGGKYQIRQVGDEVFWVDDGRPTYINAFHGKISANTVRGQWVDLPGGRSMNAGTVEFRIESPEKLVKVSTEGTRFGGSYIVRGGAFANDDRNRAMRTAPLVGRWRWTTGGAPLVVNPDGTFTGVGSRGNWKALDAANRIYELDWEGGNIDRVQISSDGTKLENTNPFDHHVIATKAR